MSLSSNPFDPAREAALVTGAGNGIGRAIAQALTGEGMRTVFAVNLDAGFHLACEMALALLSNRVSAYVTGAAIVVDGGLSLTNWFDPPDLRDL